MITSNSGGWILPKGGWEEDESAQEAAAREAYEEAGVLGDVKHALPDVRFAGKKGGACRMILFVMDVKELLERWPEAQQRRRELFTLEEAMDKTRPEMRRCLSDMVSLGLHLPLMRNQRNRNNSPPAGSSSSSSSSSSCIPASETAAHATIEVVEEAVGGEAEKDANSTPGALAN